jgi:DNA polymerase III delta prime subunit
MQPSPLAKNATPQFQQRVIDHCKASRGVSQFFLGPVGCGKTALQYALWRNWVGHIVDYYIQETYSNYWPIWNVDANELLDQHHAYVTSRETTDDKGNTIKPKYPEVTPELVRQVANRYPLDEHFKPVLVLREIDKLNATEFKVDVLFKIIGRLHDDKGVLILDSNLTWEEFVARFGLPLSRRVRVLCHMVDYHTQTIELPSEEEATVAAQ